MVAYFCHHLSDNYVDLSDLYVVLSDLYVVLSDHYVYLSEKYHHNQQLNTLFSYPVNATNCHLLVSLISESQHHYLTSKHNFLTSGHNDLTSRHNYKKVIIYNNYVDLSDNDVYLSDLYVDSSAIMLTCQIILLLSVWHSLGKNTFLRFIF